MPGTLQRYVLQAYNCADIQKNPNGGWFMSVELEDGASVRSVTIADVRDVERI